MRSFLLVLCACIGCTDDGGGDGQGAQGAGRGVAPAVDAGNTGLSGGDECCPARPPKLATTCPCPGLDCVYLDCADTGQTVAGCNQATGLWDIAKAPCRTPECGELCSEDGLCLVRIGDGTIDECADNPCGKDPITCECAHAVCPGRCLGVEGRRVTCDVCPSGPCPPAS